MGNKMVDQIANKIKFYAKKLINILKKKSGKQNRFFLFFIISIDHKVNLYRNISIFFIVIKIQLGGVN